MFHFWQKKRILEEEINKYSRFLVLEEREGAKELPYSRIITIISHHPFGGPTTASSVNLGEQLEAFITEAVKKGRYGSRSEVLREGVRLVQEREALLARAHAEIQKGIDAVERGDSEDAEIVFARLAEKYRAMAAKAAE